MPPLTYIWTAEADADLRSAYQGSPTRKQLTRALRDVGAKHSKPHGCVLRRAQGLALARDLRKPWTAEEREYLRRNAGQSTKQIALMLGRTWSSVQGQLQLMKVRRVRVGRYTKVEVRELLSVSWSTLQRWTQGGVLPVVDGCITEMSLLRFLCEHPDEVDTRRIDLPLMRSLLQGMARKMRELDRYRNIEERELRKKTWRVELLDALVEENRADRRKAA